MNGGTLRETAARAAFRSLGTAALLLLWEIAPRLGWADPQFLPSFSTVMETILRLLAEGALAGHAVVSLWRALAGLCLALVIAVPSGLLLGRARPETAEAADPLLRILGQVNPFSLMPVFLFFFGLGEKAKVAVLAWACIWPILHNTAAGIRAIDPSLLRTAASMGIAGGSLFIRVLLPASARSVFAGLRVGAGLAFFMLIGAEMLGAGAGLGWFLHSSAAQYQVPRIYAAGVLIVLLGTASNKSLRYLERRIFAWEDRMLPVARESEPAIRPIRRGALIPLALSLAAVLLLGGRLVKEIDARGADVTRHGGGERHAGHDAGNGGSPGGKAIPGGRLPCGMPIAGGSVAHDPAVSGGNEGHEDHAGNEGHHRRMGHHE